MAGKEISATVPDWQREAVKRGEWNPGKFLLRSIRDYQRHRQSGGIRARIGRTTSVLRHRLWSIVSGADIPLNCEIGGGLLIPHPNGIVIHPESRIGPNCLLFQQVTIGVTDGRPPQLEGHVDVGAGARVLGEIAIGAHARIGANAVVLTNVAPYSTVAGIPAKVLSRKSSEQE